jgi:hypothetical protein
MPAKEVASKPRPRFDYAVCADIIAAGCILEIASRPDGLAITISAVIVAIGAVICRCAIGAKRYVADKTRSPKQPTPDLDRKRTPVAQPEPPPAPVERRPDRRSWLRDNG